MGTRAATENGDDFRCPWHDTHVENMGKNGKNGRLGNAIKDVAEMKADIKKIKYVQTRMGVKLALFTSAGSLAGGGLVATLAKYLG